MWSKLSALSFPHLRNWGCLLNVFLFSANLTLLSKTSEQPQLGQPTPTTNNLCGLLTSSKRKENMQKYTVLLRAASSQGLQQRSLNPKSTTQTFNLLWALGLAMALLHHYTLLIFLTCQKRPSLSFAKNQHLCGKMSKNALIFWKIFFKIAHHFGKFTKNAFWNPSFQKKFFSFN